MEHASGLMWQQMPQQGWGPGAGMQQMVPEQTQPMWHVVEKHRWCWSQAFCCSSDIRQGSCDPVHQWPASGSGRPSGLSLGRVASARIAAAVAPASPATTAPATLIAPSRIST
jgi:hypothetical protein